MLSLAIGNKTYFRSKDLLGHNSVTTYTQYTKRKLNTKDSIDKQSH